MVETGPIPPKEPARVDPPDRGRPDQRRTPRPRRPETADEEEPPPPGHIDVIA